METQVDSGLVLYRFLRILREDISVTSHALFYGEILSSEIPTI